MNSAPPSDPDQVLALLDAPIPAAAVAVALKLRLFWLLEAGARDSAEIGSALGVPAGRARRWLDLLRGLGLVEAAGDRWTLAPAGRRAITESFSPEAWGMLADEAIERLGRMDGLEDSLRSGLHGRRRATYVELMAADPDRARRFCRMLYELHGPLAARVAGALDLPDSKRLLDLGGGSGVVAVALARRNPELRVTVVDIPAVCVAGREIVAGEGLAGRIEFAPADFLRDDLPGGFDAAVECDVGVYSEELFGRVHAALRPGSPFAIVDEFPGDAERTDLPHLGWAFERSLSDPDFVERTTAGTAAMLAGAGFEIASAGALPPLPNVGGRVAGLTLLLARTARLGPAGRA